MRRSPSNRPHTRRGSIHRTIFLLLPTVLLSALSQSGCGLTLTSAGTSAGVPVMPSIATQPTNQTVAVGQTATFFVTTSGAAPLSYQWEKNGTAISGAISASYTTQATTISDNGSPFAVVVGNSRGSVTSNTATLTVNTAPIAITVNPNSVTVT